MLCVCLVWSAVRCDASSKFSSIQAEGRGGNILCATCSGLWNSFMLVMLSQRPLVRLIETDEHLCAWGPCVCVAGRRTGQKGWPWPFSWLLYFISYTLLLYYGSAMGSGRKWYTYTHRMGWFDALPSLARARALSSYSKGAQRTTIQNRQYHPYYFMYIKKLLPLVSERNSRAICLNTLRAFVSSFWLVMCLHHQQQTLHCEYIPYEYETTNRWRNF